MNLGNLKLRLSQLKALKGLPLNYGSLPMIVEGKTETDSYCFAITDFEVSGGNIFFKSEDLDEILKKVEGVTLFNFGDKT